MLNYSTDDLLWLDTCLSSLCERDFTSFLLLLALQVFVPKRRRVILMCLCIFLMLLLEVYRSFG